MKTFIAYLLLFSTSAFSQSLLTGVLTSNAAMAQVAQPTASPTAGTYSGTQSVALSSATAGATICYTIDNSTPTAPTPGTCPAGTTTYSGAISVSSTTTIKAIATKAGSTNSGVLTATYTITLSVSDTFTGSAGPISSSTWETFINAPQLDGSGNVVCGTSFNECVARWKTSVNTFPADHAADLVVTTTTADYSGPMVRVNSSGFGYIARIISGAVEIDKFTAAGTFSILRSNSQCASATVAATNTVRLGVIGTTLTAYKNGTAISGCTITDSTYSTGQPGIYLNKSSTSASYTSFAAVSQ